MNGHFRYELWYADSDPCICDDLGKPLPDGWYCNLFTPNVRYPGVFGPYPTGEEALTSVKARIKEIDSAFNCDILSK